MKQNTPEQEKELVCRSTEIQNYKFILNKTKAYKGFSINDVIIHVKRKQKYKITYIDTEYGLIYGRRINAIGTLGKVLTHITGLFGIFQVDPDQISALLVGDTYDPAARSKEAFYAKREATKARTKQRTKIPGSVKIWVKKELKVGQIIWMTADTTQEKFADECKYTVLRRNVNHLMLYCHRSKTNLELNYNHIRGFNIYLQQPIMYKEIP